MPESMNDAPRSIEAEKELLGHVLLYPELVQTVKDQLDPNDFYDECHRAIWNKMITGCSLDEIFLYEELKHLRSVTGGELVSLSYLLSLTDGRIRLDSVDRWIEILKKKRIQRDAWELSIQLREFSLGDWEQTRKGIESVSADIGKMYEFARYIGGEKIVDPAQRGKEYFRQRFILHENKKDRLSVPGWDAFNSNIGGGFKHGRNYVIASRPGSGKTSFIVHLAAAFSKQGKPGLMIQIENPAFDIWDKIVANVCQLDSLDISNRPDSLTEEQHNRVLDAVNAHSRNIYIEHDNTMKIEEIIQKIMAYKKQFNIQWFMLDYLQRIQGDKRRNELENITRHVTELDELAEKLDLVCIMISMANREAEGTKIGMRNMKGSGEIEQAADVLIALQTKEEMADQKLEEIEVDILKNRQGKKGPVKMMFKKSFSHFSESYI